VATIRKRNGQWQVQVRRRGFDPVSKTFTTRQDATGWARLIEAEMDRNVYVPRKAAEPFVLLKAPPRIYFLIGPTLYGGGPLTIAGNAARLPLKSSPG
jgi:hypothetical protein